MTHKNNPGFPIFDFPVVSESLHTAVLTSTGGVQTVPNDKENLVFSFSSGPKAQLLCSTGCAVDIFHALLHN